jgi:hypothetical protein
MTQAIRAALAVAIALSGATAAQAADPHPFPQEAAGVLPERVPFTGFDAIYNWRVDDHGALLIRTAWNRYYRATFAAPCPELPSAISIGFVTEVAAPLNTWSSIYVDGDRCWFKSFEQVDASVFEGA